jgi:hypothetical protein
VYTAKRVRQLLIDWGALRRGELGYPTRGRDDLGTTILSSTFESRLPLRVELLDVDAAVCRLGAFERRVVTSWYAVGTRALAPLGLADPFVVTDILAAAPNDVADVRGVDAPDGGERVAHDLGYRWQGRCITDQDCYAARNRALEQMARTLRATTLAPQTLPPRTNLAEVFQRQTPANQQILDRWLDGHTPAELARMFDRNESSMRYIIRRFRAALRVVDIALLAAV